MRICPYKTIQKKFKSKTTRSNRDKTQSKSIYFKIPTMSMRHEEKIEQAMINNKQSKKNKVTFETAVIL